MGKTVQDEINEARARGGLPPLPPKQERKKQKNPRGLKIVPPVETPPAEPVRTGAESAPVQKPIPEPVRHAPGAHSAGARKTQGYLRVTNELIDDILPTLTPGAQAVLLRLYRLTRGFNADVVTVSKGTLANRCHVKETALRGYLKELVNRGHIRRLGEDTANPDRRLRGMSIQVLVSGAEPARNTQGSEIRTGAENAPNKEKHYKENLKGDSRCDLCRETGGFIYRDPNDRSKGVIKCSHGAG
jgi:hypothetical protein